MSPVTMLRPRPAVKRAAYLSATAGTRYGNYLVHQARIGQGLPRILAPIELTWREILAA